MINMNVENVKEKNSLNKIQTVYVISMEINHVNQDQMNSILDKHLKILLMIAHQ